MVEEGIKALVGAANGPSLIHPRRIPLIVVKEGRSDQQRSRI